MKNLLLILILLPLYSFCQSSAVADSLKTKVYKADSMFPFYFRVVEGVWPLDNNSFITEGCCNALIGGSDNGIIRSCNVEIKNSERVTLVDCVNVYVRDTKDRVLHNLSNKKCWDDDFFGIRYFKCVDIVPLENKCCGCVPVTP